MSTQEDQKVIVLGEKSYSNTLNETISIYRPNQEEDFDSFCIAEEDINVVGNLFGGRIQGILASSKTTPEEKESARIESLVAATVGLLKIANILEVSCKNPTISQFLYKQSHIMGTIAYKLIEEESSSIDEGISEETLQPILDLLANVNVELPDDLK